MATYIFHRLIMVKVNVDISFCFNVDIWNLFAQQCLLSCLLSLISFLSKPLNLTVYQGDQKGKF